MINGPMREVAADLSLEQKTAVADYIAERKINETNSAEAGIACEGAATEFDLSRTPVSALGSRGGGEPLHVTVGGARHREKYCLSHIGLGLCLCRCDPSTLVTGIRCVRLVRW